MAAQTNQPTDDEDEPLDIGLLPWQFDSVFNHDSIRWLNIVGGRGAGKSYTDVPRVFRWAEMCTELAYGLFAATDTLLQTMLAPIRKAADDLHIEHVYESQAPQEWRDAWDMQGIKYPPARLREGKFWIWETGAHFYTGSVINNAYTRAKGIDFNAILFAEYTEPGVTIKALLTLFAGLRCGSATQEADGLWYCRQPGHLHMLVTSGNVPLNDPSHFIYKKNEQLQKQERERELAHKPPFYRLLEIPTRANPMTGEMYDDGLRSMYDPQTYDEQTAGNLRRRTEHLSYYAFSEQNILDTLTYDSKRPLYMWFDWNALPAVAGWGHDMRLDEVPEPMRRKGRHYFAIVGELFSDNDPMTTDQVASALLVDPTRKSGACIEDGCHHDMERHLETGSGFLCAVCQWRAPNVKPVQHCSGGVMQSPLRSGLQQSYLHAPPNWRGLVNHRGRIYVYGDANDGRGTAAAIAGGSIKILREMFGDALGDRVEFRIPSVNPLVKLRTLTVNRGFRDGHDIASVYIHSRCEAHIADFHEVIPDANGDPLKVSKSPSQRRAGNDYWKRTDISDAWGYHWSARFPALVPKSSGLPIGPGEDDDGPLANRWATP